MNQELTDGGGFALVMLGVILLSFSVIGMLMFSLIRNASKHDPDGDQTIDNVGDELEIRSPISVKPSEGRNEENISE